uniref:Translation initiation factor eIF2B subunit epsilon n=1 Tax=Aceria tosichella TaxID=561515 RepID=A0A6G1SMD8_9ACAR
MDTTKKEDLKQAVIVDYKAIGCKSPGSGSSNKKPYIQYSLEWLLIEQFDEIFVCCLPDNAQQLREFVKFFLRTQDVPESMTIQVHASESNCSTGDCLRDLDSKVLLKTDFIIMDVGCCGNLSLTELLDSHKRLKKQDKNAILTSVVRTVFTKHLTDLGEFPIYVSDPSTGLLLHYVAGRIAENEKPGPLSSSLPSIKSINVPSQIFLERASVKIHTNLCSTNLSIYSSNVPALYTELFDCHSEADLIQAAFDNHEVLGGTVYIHAIDDFFSQRMADFGFAINQKRDKFDTNLIYKRNAPFQVLRKLVNDSLIECTRLNPENYLSTLNDDEESDNESESSSEQSEIDDDEVFFSEVLDSLIRGYEEAIKNENLVLEVNSSKHAYNIGIDDVYATIAKALLCLPEKLHTKPGSYVEYSRMVESAIDKFAQFLLNYMKSEESKSIFLSTMERLCITRQLDYLNDTVLAKVLYKLYEIDALDEESILRWFEDYDMSDEDQKSLRTKAALRQLVEALEAESDEEEDDDDDGEDDDDDDC